MTLDELKVKLENVYSDYAEATQKYRTQARELANLERELKMDILDAYAANLIEGKNQTQREAAEQEMFRSQIDKIEEQKKLQDLCYEERERAQIQLDYIRDLIRIEEIATKTI